MQGRHVQVYKCALAHLHTHVLEGAFSLNLLSMSMPGNKVSSHPLETLNGVHGVPGVRTTLAWLAEDLSSGNEIPLL